MVGIWPPHSGRRAFVPHNAWRAEGDDILPPPPQASTAAQAGPPFPTQRAVVRYNVTPVDGLFFQRVPSLPFHYGLRLRYLGQLTAKLMEVDLATGSETELVHFDSANFPGESAVPGPNGLRRTF
jgi:hypothetical protein